MYTGVKNTRVVYALAHAQETYLVHATPTTTNALTTAQACYAYSAITSLP